MVVMTSVGKWRWLSKVLLLSSSEDHTLFLLLFFDSQTKNIFSCWNRWSRNIKVTKIPFHSEEEYLGSFTDCLREETRAQLASCLGILNRAPISKKSNGHRNYLYEVRIDLWISSRGAEMHRILPSDVVILANRRLKSLFELQDGAVDTWSMAVV